MNTYDAVFGPHAEEEALEAAEYIAAMSPAGAAKWFAGLEKVIHSLGAMPHRCGQAREAKMLGRNLRQYIYHSHRIIFRIEEEAAVVRILHIRHAARRALRQPDET